MHSRSDAHTSDKASMRREMRASLRALPQELLQAESVCPPGASSYPLSRLSGAALVARLVSSRVFKDSKRVGAYVSSERLREVDTHGLLRELFCPTSGKQCFVPVVGTGRAEMHFVHVGAPAYAATVSELMRRSERFHDLRPGSMGILEPASSPASGWSC